MPGWSLHDRAFLITGGARGICAATAQALHARGARLALVDLDEAALEQTATMLAIYESEAREKGADEVAWSERTRRVMRDG
jgi:NAD(P)-dependent dehydrogenase (short-subunit alcohol dehydrogenase family)